MQRDISKVLLTERELSDRIRELGKEITRDYNGKPLHLVGILKGCLLYTSTLNAQTPNPSPLSPGEWSDPPANKRLIKFSVALVLAFLASAALAGGLTPVSYTHLFGLRDAPPAPFGAAL